MKNLIGMIILGMLVGCGGAHMGMNNPVPTGSGTVIKEDPMVPPITAPVANASANPSPDNSVTYEKDIKPKYFAVMCINCHNPSSPPMMPNWMDYDIAYAKRDRIYDRVVVRKDMPMGGSLTDAQRNEIAEWVKQGAPK